jgi:hypothetical protein
VGRVGAVDGARVLVERVPHFGEQRDEVGRFRGGLWVFPVDVESVEAEAGELLITGVG